MSGKKGFKIPKPPGRGSCSSFAMYTKAKYREINDGTASEPELQGAAALDFSGRATILGNLWNALSDEAKKPFEAMMLETPHIAQRLLEMTLDELDAAREWMLVLGRKTAREKIASLLSIIARRDASLKLNGTQGPLVFDLPLTREAMADYLGLTLETVSRQMSALKRDGVIRLEGKRHVTIPDFTRLMTEAGDDNDGGMMA